jgi:ornithine cyclodeaminase
MRILSVQDVIEIVERHGFEQAIDDLIKRLRGDYARWEEFTKMPRPAMHVRDGVIELMPICDHEYYTFKYVNGHPKNPERGKQTVMATGQLARVLDGEPLLYVEMAVLTALRTAATSALATDLMARKNAKVLAIIGTGSQSEFQVRAAQRVRPLTEVRYFDIDPLAMQKFARNMQGSGLKLSPAKNVEEAVCGADIITVCTACKDHVDVVKNDWVRPGVHINGLGGDCPGKTELEQSILPRAKVVVEYFDQSFIEGEIQRLSEAEARNLIQGELHEFVTSKKGARLSAEDITVFDSVGIALEDYSALRWVYDLADYYEIGQDRDFVPPQDDPKDLFGNFGPKKPQKSANSRRRQFAGI